MSMEITQVFRAGSVSPPKPATGRPKAGTQTESQRRVTAAARQASNQELQRFTKELQRVSQVFNRRLSFYYHEELGQVVVKVIDKETDTVIKELPPDELQRVHLRIREAIGLLLDETI